MEGLTNGLFYRFLAESSNTIGSTGLSAPGDPLQVGKNPGRPQGLTVVAQEGGRALATWLPPATDGGLPITAYTVSTTAGKLSCRTTGALQCTLTGLEVGRTYTVIASATNEAGSSVASLTGPTVTGIA
ncbi:MAG: fibronectin type III domain-containing protein [Candidatus Nanopelagicales bacterium]